MKGVKILLKKRLQSFKYAFNGLKILFREEANAQIHLGVALCVSVAGFAFRISGDEWIAVLLCIGLVISLEAINSAVENLADFVSQAKHETIKKIKDLAAAAVLIGALVSIAVGLMVFLPKFAKVGEYIFCITLKVMEQH
ncbi:MAG: diacylglycerol kinase family protein [Dysgonamonadaceae bacterium]|jgi:diacylglycerol kinase|nr:diacylglycerol kinase family protein [Dysgonamonadaceae bacterium]